MYIVRMRVHRSMCVQNATMRVIHCIQMITLTGTLKMISQEARDKLINLLKFEEGFREFPYDDTKGNLTILYGHNLGARPLSKKVGNLVLEEDVDYFLQHIPKEIKYFPYLTDNRKIAVVSMVYNLGVKGFLEFVNFHLAMESRNWLKASDEVLNSKAAKQLPKRYGRIAYMILHDDGDVYGTS